MHAMDEYEESDVEMVAIEEEDARKTPNPKTVDSPEKLLSTFTTGVDVFSKEEKLKMEERAKRFGLTDTFKNLNEEENLYNDMGITDDNENAKNVRLNVIHMRGTEEMSTKDVFKYFQDYAPQTIEWINDVSCNVVWFDNVSTARAMLGLSKRIKGSVPKHSDREKNIDNDVIKYSEDEFMDMDKDRKENCVNIKDINCPLPPGTWRKGIDHPKSKGIFLRFATRMDKKQAKAEKLSEYYKKYGNPNFGGIKGILTESRKRAYRQNESNHKLTNEDKQVKNPWGALSKTWGLNDVIEKEFLPRKNNVRDQRRNIKERLGVKYLNKDMAQREESEEASSSNSDSDEDWCKRSKIPRMRMHADDEEKKLQKRRLKLHSQSAFINLNSNDLRSKLEKPRVKQFHEPIQVVVVNMHPVQSKKNSDAMRQHDRHVVREPKTPEKEEGEWQESGDENGQEEELKEKKEEEKEEKQRREQHIFIEKEDEKVDEEEEEIEHKEDEDDSDEENSDVPAREVQGPKGSVIKVVPRKPRIASTVWARLNHVKSEVSNNSYLKSRQLNSRDLRNTLKSGDLRSRIGKHTRGRSPLRIEVKNDKYTKNYSENDVCTN